METKLTAKIDALDAKFEAKIIALDAKIDAMDAKFEAKIDVLDSRIRILDANVHEKWEQSLSIHERLAVIEAKLEIR